MKISEKERKFLGTDLQMQILTIGHMVLFNLIRFKRRAINTINLDSDHEIHNKGRNSTGKPLRYP